MDDKIKKLYMNGFTYIEIAKQLNTSEIKIKHIIDIRLNNYKELHLRNKLKRDNLYKSCNFDIKDLYVVGYNAREIANKLGHKYENVQKYIQMREYISKNLSEYKIEHKKNRVIKKEMIRAVDNMNNSYISNSAILEWNRQSYDYNENGNIVVNEKHGARPLDLPKTFYNTI